MSAKTEPAKEITPAEYREQRVEFYRSRGEDYHDAHAWAKDDTTAHYAAKAASHAQEAADSFERCDTDGFVSQWASDMSSRVARRNAEIAANDGLAEFPALFDLDGNLVPAKLIHIADRYSFNGGTKPMWGVLENDDPRSRVTKWITPFPVRKSTMTRKGYTEGTVLAPGVAKTWAPPGARGLGGCTQVSVIVERTDGGFSRDVEIVTTCVEYDKN